MRQPREGPGPDDRRKDAVSHMGPVGIARLGDEDRRRGKLINLSGLLNTNTVTLNSE